MPTPTPRRWLSFSPPRRGLFGRPKYVITDLGGEFQGRIFAKTAGRLGIRHRFASALNIYATARWGPAGEESSDPPFSVAYLDPQSRRFPILDRAA